jgi:hypothetical protein
MRNFKTLETTVQAVEEGRRIRDEFSYLCKLIPTLVECEANFRIIMGFFEPDLLLFDRQAGLFAIENDDKLAKRLAWRTKEQIVEDNAVAIKEQNERQKARPVSELHEELQQRDREFRESLKKPKPPVDLTRKKFRGASSEEARMWVTKYGYEGLNRHWAEQEALGNV